MYQCVGCNVEMILYQIELVLFVQKIVYFDELYGVVIVWFDIVCVVGCQVDQMEEDQDGKGDEDGEVEMIGFDVDRICLFVFFCV